MISNIEDYVSASVGTPRTINVSTMSFSVSFKNFKAPLKIWQFCNVRHHLEAYLDGKPNLIYPKIFQLFNEDYQDSFVSKVTDMQASGISGEKPHIIDAVLKSDQVYDHATFMAMPYDHFMSIYARLSTFVETTPQLDSIVRESVKLFLDDVKGPTTLMSQMHFAITFASKLRDIHQLISWAEFAAQTYVKVSYHHSQVSRIPNGYTKILMEQALKGGYNILLEEYIEKVTLPDPTNASFVVKWKNIFNFNSDITEYIVREAISASRNRVQQISLSKQLEFNRANQNVVVPAAKQQSVAISQSTTNNRPRFMLKPAASDDKKKSSTFFFKKPAAASDLQKRTRFNNMQAETADAEDVDTMVDDSKVSDRESLSALASYSANLPATSPFKERKSFDATQPKPARVCDGILLRDRCPNEGTCTYKHDKALVDLARKKLANQWLADRPTTFHYMQSSGLFEGMEQDEFDHIIKMLDDGELPPAADPRTDIEKFNFLESVCNIQE